MSSPTAEVSKVAYDQACLGKGAAPSRQTVHSVLTEKAYHHNSRALAFGVLADLTKHLRGVEEEAVNDLFSAMRVWDVR